MGIGTWGDEFCFVRRLLTPPVMVMNPEYAKEMILLAQSLSSNRSGQVGQGPAPACGARVMHKISMTGAWHVSVAS